MNFNYPSYEYYMPIHFTQKLSEYSLKTDDLINELEIIELVFNKNYTSYQILFEDHDYGIRNFISINDFCLTINLTEFNSQFSYYQAKYMYPVNLMFRFILKRTSYFIYFHSKKNK